MMTRVIGFESQKMKSIYIWPLSGALTTAEKLLNTPIIYRLVDVQL